MGLLDSARGPYLPSLIVGGSQFFYPSPLLQQGESAWLFSLTWESQRFSLQQGQAWQVTTRRTISTLHLEGTSQVF